MKIKTKKETLYPVCSISKKKILERLKKDVSFAIKVADPKDWQELFQKEFSIDLALETFNNPKNSHFGVLYAPDWKRRIIKNLL